MVFASLRFPEGSKSSKNMKPKNGAINHRRKKWVTFSILHKWSVVASQKLLTNKEQG